MNKERYREYLTEQIEKTAVLAAEMDRMLSNDIAYASAIECIKIQNFLMSELYRLDNNQI